jgi:hypothetical protein
MKNLTGPWAAACAMTALMLWVTGCKSSSEGSVIPPTTSGFPEVILPAKPIERIQTVAREFFKNRGYVEHESRHAYEQVFDKRANSGKPDEALRIVIRLQNEPNGAWRMIGMPMKVESWHSSLESAVVVPQGKVQIQGFLDQIKAQVEASS